MPSNSSLTSHFTCLIYLSYFVKLLDHKNHKFSLKLYISDKKLNIKQFWVNFIVSVIWSSTLLTSGSLQQNVIDAAVNKWRKWLEACMFADVQHFEYFCEFLMKASKYELATNEV